MFSDILEADSQRRRFGIEGLVLKLLLTVFHAACALESADGENVGARASDDRLSFSEEDELMAGLGMLRRPLLNCQSFCTAEGVFDL